MQYKKEEVHNKILKAALKEFSRAGFYRAKMLQISKRSRVPIGNLYKYFPSKENLFEALVDKAASQAQVMIDFFFYRHLAVDNLEEHTEELKYVSYAVSEYIKEYKVEFLMIVEKSFGSSYEGFSSTIIKRIASILPVGKTEQSSLIAEVLAKSLIESILILAKQCPDSELYTQIVNILMFFFSAPRLEFDENVELPKNKEVKESVLKLIEKNQNKVNKIYNL